MRNIDKLVSSLNWPTYPWKICLHVYKSFDHCIFLQQNPRNPDALKTVRKWNTNKYISFTKANKGSKTTWKVCNSRITNKFVPIKKLFHCITLTLVRPFGWSLLLDALEYQTVALFHCTPVSAATFYHCSLSLQKFNRPH